ncbi:amino acid ABC transporter ATP-binding protein [Treponema peruense]|uniref:Amino acid ABC transporter ATP-binding protein n=1 Tax=Treponema peruense TaxID=2787628 RepID=A0A7T3RFE7_9SPIR|nr:amino acid ABC transporter ATP-binding protein [Treponema peruense]QQA02044.1 amino acid ABC transporter ATP-binding protein [Treponema peruense]
MALLEIIDVKKDFREAGGILKGVSLSVERGEVVVILGPSGCGKSTLLRCINGLESIQGGTISLDGEVISNRTKEMHLIRQKVGMVFQSYDLFPHMTVLQNILLGPMKAQKRSRNEVESEAEALLKRVGLYEKKDAYPRQLSGGQKQRVAIVRALCMHPQVMLFDEVTAALDPEMVREVLDVMIELAKEGQTMLIVTHQLEFARAVADKIVFIDDGLIVEEDTPEQFFNNPRTERARKFLSAFMFDRIEAKK